MTANPDVELVFVELQADTAVEAKERVERALLLLSYPGWEVLPALQHQSAAKIFGVEVRAPQGTGRRTGWDVAHSLSAQLDARAEAVLAGEIELPDLAREAEEGLFGHAVAPAPSWHLDDIRAAGLNGAGDGSGILIGHPDTGTSRHAELGTAVRLDLGHNLLEDGPPWDPLKPPGEPGHGTATASLIISPPGSQLPGQPPITGLAPGAEVVPIRVTSSVVVLAWQARLARAIELAVDRGCHVISLSLGGLPASRLRWAIRYARSSGVIVVAAAGNYVPFVVWPAAYPDVIGVAASTPGRRVWRWSAGGPAVDVTAPGADVWVARWSGANPTVGTGSGTSFATALVAGAAALWLSKHGVENLRQKYPGSALCDAFQHVLRASVDSNLDTGRSPRSWFGGGLLDCKKLLSAPLPAAESLAALRREAGDALEGGLASLLPSAHDEAVPRFRSIPGSEAASIELVQSLVLDPKLRAASAEGPPVPAEASALLRSLLTRPKPRDRSAVAARERGRPLAPRTPSVPAAVPSATARASFTLPVEITVRVQNPTVKP